MYEKIKCFYHLISILHILVIGITEKLKILFYPYILKNILLYCKKINCYAGKKLSGAPAQKNRPY